MTNRTDVYYLIRSTDHIINVYVTWERLRENNGREYFLKSPPECAAQLIIASRL